MWCNQLTWLYHVTLAVWCVPGHAVWPGMRCDTGHDVWHGLCSVDQCVLGYALTIPRSVTGAMRRPDHAVLPRLQLSPSPGHLEWPGKYGVWCIVDQPDCFSKRTIISCIWVYLYSAYSLSAWRKLGSLATHWAHSEDSDSDQTEWMPRLIWVFAGRTLILLVLSCHGSYVVSTWQVFKVRFTWRSQWCVFEVGNQ